MQGTFAYHVNFGRVDALDQLSFAISASYVQNSVDQRSFTIPDPVISQIVESDSYFNSDFSMAYFNLDGYAYFTVKNLLLNSRKAMNENFRSLNLRRYLLNVGYFIGWGKRIQVEPSIMFQFIENTKEVIYLNLIRLYSKQRIRHKIKAHKSELLIVTKYNLSALLVF